MTATLIAFLVCGFFAAGLVSVYQFLVLAAGALVLLVIAMLLEDYSGLEVFEGVASSFAVSQIGFGLGLAWIARSTANRGRRMEN